MAVPIEEKRKAIADYVTGRRTAKQIAKDLGITRQGVHRWMDGISTPKNLTEDEKKALVAIYNHGITARYICRLWGFSTQTISNWSVRMKPEVTNVHLVHGYKMLIGKLKEMGINIDKELFY